MKQWLSSRPWLLEVLLVGALTAGALVLRLYRLSDIPPGFHGDPAELGLQAQRIARGEWLGVWTPVALGELTGYLYWMAFLFKLGSPSIFMERLSSALVGAATVPIAYLLFRLLFAPRVAFLAAALIAFSFWHSVLSRAAMGSHIFMVFFLLLSLYLLFLGRQRGSWPFFTAEGILIGLGFYTHKSFPLYYAGISAFLLLRLYLSNSSRERWGTLVFLSFSLVVAIPFLVWFFQNQDIFSNRFNMHSLFDQPAYLAAHGLWGKAGVIGNRIKEVFLYVHNPLPREFGDGTGGKALLDRASEAFFWLGLVTTLMRIREPGYQLVVMGLLSGSVTAIMVPFGELRNLLWAMPFVMLCVALGLDTGTQTLSCVLRKLEQRSRLGGFYEAFGRGAAVIGLAGFLAFFSFANITYHFRNWAYDPMVKWVHVYDFVKAIEYLKMLDPNTHIYFYSDRWSYDYGTRRFLLPEMSGEDRSKEFAGSVSLERRHDGKVVYVMMRDYSSLAHQLQSLYPEGNYHEVRDSDGSLIFAAYVL